MRVLHLGTDSFGGHGGIALYNRDFIAAVASHPHCEEILVVPRVVKQQLEPLPPKTTFLAGAARGRPAYGSSVLRLLRERGRFDLVICAHINLLPAATLFSSTPLLLIYGIEAWKPSRRDVRRAGAVVSISDITLSRFKSWSRYAGATFLLPNAIHMDDYGVTPPDAEMARRFGVDGKRVLLTFGRLAPEERYKGFDEVLDVLPAVAQCVPDVKYVIAGSGEDRSRLERKARELHVGDRVVFTGHVDEEKKAALYSLADVYVMPSRGEGFGYVLLEAMACGVPVIASRHDGGREAVRDGQLGVLVDPANPAELRTAITDLLAAPQERRVPEGLAHFGYERFVERTHAIIDRLLESSR